MLKSVVNGAHRCVRLANVSVTYVHISLPMMNPRFDDIPHSLGDYPTV